MLSAEVKIINVNNFIELFLQKLQGTLQLRVIFKELMLKCI